MNQTNSYSQKSARYCDPRVRYTRMVIREAFLELLKEKPFPKITVKEICALAELNRTTFYKHYRDPADLLNELENEAIDRLLALIGECAGQNPEQILVPVFRTLKQHHDLFECFVWADKDKNFTCRLAGRCFDRIRALTRQKGDAGVSVPAEPLRFSYIAGGVSGVIEYWLRSGMKESPETLAQTIQAFHSSLIQSAAGGPDKTSMEDYYDN